MTTKYEGWLTFNAEKEKLRLPVLPEKLRLSIGSKDSSVDIIGLGEIIIAKERPLMTTTISSFFPANPYPGLARSRIVSPTGAINQLKRWKESLKPVHFVVAGARVDFYARISKFQYEFRAEDPDSIYYDLELKEWRDTSIRSVSVNNYVATVSKLSARADNSTKPRTYTVKTGDCLWTIAERMYGDGMKYTKIYNANKDKIRADYIIYTGQVLTIPD